MVRCTTCGNDRLEEDEILGVLVCPICQTQSQEFHLEEEETDYSVETRSHTRTVKVNK